VETRILHVIDSLRRGGAESLLVKALPCFSRTYPGIAFQVLTLYAGGALEQSLQCEGIPVGSLGLGWKYDLRCLGRLARLLRSRQFDLVHVHLFPADYITALASIGSNATLVCTEHSTWNRRRRWPLLRQADRLVYRQYRAIICVSEAVRASLQQWLPELAGRTVVVPNGVEVRDSAREGRHQFDLVFVGRLVPEKGADLLLAACAELRRRGVRCRTALVGSGAWASRLTAMARQEGLAEEVEFLGERADVEELLRRSRIFVLPARWEVLPMALLEAMAAGLPVITTGVGGIAEVVRDGREGLIVPDGGGNALADAVTVLLHNPRLRDQLGQAARNTVGARFSLQMHVARLARLYGSLLGREFLPGSSPAGR